MEPCAVFFCVAEAVVEAIVAALPEFDGFGDDSEATPEVGFRNRAGGETLFEFRVAGKEVVAGGDFRALVRDPGADAASAWAAIEICC